MKTLLNLVAATMLLVATQNANAISLRFKFKTFSSGPNIYACNAGLLHKATNRQVCYFEGTKNACTPNTCADGQTCNTKCVCTSSGGGEYLMDYLKAEVANWQDNGNPQGPYTAITKQAGNSDFNTLVSDSDAWGKTIQQMHVDLGSELYGAQYFVDVCYRGPQIEYFKDGVNANFSVLAEAAATDFIANGTNPGDNSRDGLDMNPGLKYTQIADLTVQAFVTCDLQGLGNYVYAHNLNGVYNTTDNEAGFVYDSSTKLPVNSVKDLFWASSSTAASSNAVNLINSLIPNVNRSQAPRFCKVRYVFSETNANKALGLVNLRKWQRHGAEMCTYTRVNEDDTTEMVP